MGENRPIFGPRLARLLRELASVPPEELRRLADELDGAAERPRRRTARRLPPASPEAHEKLDRLLQRKGIDPKP